MMTSIKNFEHYTDLELIQNVLKGEQKLYELLIRRNNPYLYKIGRMYNFNQHDTEDLMQETFINAFYNLSKFEHKSSFKTWITKIMLNHCFHKKQKLSYQKESPTEQLHEQKAPVFQQASQLENHIMNKELGRIIEQLLRNLPEETRLVFAMRELNGLSTSETADVLGITEANVKTRLSRTKDMLRVEIEKIYAPEEIYEFNLVYCDRIVERVMTQLLK